ncbi:MAG TPA: GNAT family N-acetyltransferase [Candidatus Sulfotelmatobacter sp.]|nr:GNAT family N-acetyltransferase [Candidatus Sulfotelmatobacter sp.]
MEIRVLTANDASAYWNIRLEALERDPEAFSASAEEHRALSVEDVAARLVPADPANNFVVGAFEGERLMGTAGFFREKGLKGRHKGQIWGVYLTREARGKGVGREMMRAVLERALRLPGIEQIRVSVAASQEAAAKLYRSLGFELFGREPRALKIGDRYLDEEYLVLFVEPRRP